MIVYKYVAPERIDVIENGLIRFTQANALNDPFEVNPCFSDFREGSIEYAKSRFEGELPSEAEIAEYARREIQAFREKLFLDYLMLSLSKRNDNQLMWAHYADCHRGLVFGFDASHQYFTDPLPLKSILLEVEYSETRFILPRAEDWKSLDDTLPAFLRKNIDWGYEKELRMFVRARAASKIIMDQGVPIYLFPFPKEALSEIVFGVLTDDIIRRSMVEHVRVAYPHVRLFQASLNDSNFNLDILPFRSKE